jgi:hypothetical protein
MRAVLITLVLALVAMLAAAEVKAPVCSAAGKGVAAGPVSSADWARIQGFQVQPSLRSIDFPCPEIRSCGLNCSPSGGSTVDTGEPACREGNHVIHCPAGKTIHVTSGGCIQAACCSQFPACLCGPCAGFQTWNCA